MNEPLQAKKYTLLKNNVGELLLILDSYKVNPGKAPQVIYDAGDHAIFYRDADNTIILDYVHPEVRELLSQIKEIYVGELDGDDLVFDYMAKVEQVKKIPDVAKYLTLIPDAEKIAEK